MSDAIPGNESPQMPAEHAAAPADAAPGKAGRIVLGIAVAAALTAGGVALWRNRSEPAAPTPPVASASQQPSVDEVIARLEAKLKADPQDAESWRMLGWSYFQTERFAESATALRRATKLDPKTAETWSFLGEALVLASNEEGKIPADAQAAFEQALKLDPKDARSRYFKAVSVDLAGDHRRALDLWFELLADTPADAPYADDVREVIQQVGKKNKINVEKRLAEARFAEPAGGKVTDGAERAAAGIPGPTQDQMKAAAALPKGQQEAMVLAMVDGLETKLKANPNNPDGWIMLLRSRMQLGETRKATSALQQGLAAMRNDIANARRIREAASSLGVPEA